MLDTYQSQRITMAFVDHRCGRVGVKVRGSRLRRTAIDFLLVHLRLAVIRDQRQIDGDPARLAQQCLGQFGHQAKIQTPLEFGNFWQALSSALRIV